MKYTLHTLLDDNKNFFYCILEEATQQVIDAFLFKDDAEKKFTFLQKGGAFDGFTPAFMLKKVNTSTSVDDEFERMMHE